ncbi:hypothetical protein Slin15195_G031540 [Septoria linicola]|uniref:Uncharacterized protein n=1 Tax=Septoria linicola TaxID=215465 RepID=A0A9Q9AIT9_9PEZI|nr:hypothetical protein Slin15195_G031540 [Septoria linicola]
MSFVLELQTLVHTVGVTPVFQVTELTEITVDANSNNSNASLPEDVSSSTPWATGT